MKRRTVLCRLFHKVMFLFTHCRRRGVTTLILKHQKKLHILIS